MDPIAPMNPESIVRAAELLRRGELVAFPTETVYGLGADATNDTAVARIFEAKNRPSFNPLIVHVPDPETAAAYAVFTPMAESMAARFWPGPLTLVLPRRPDCGLSRLTSAGLDTVAMRVPSHDSARQLLRSAGIPIAAPSANRSGLLSPTTAEHVADQLGDHVAMILDDGPCAIGLESTVLDLSEETPAILRQGGLPQEEIEDALGGPVAIASADDDAPKSPGMLTRHYAPSRPLRMNASAAQPGEALLGFGRVMEATKNLSPDGDLVEAAANLFAFLHALDTPHHGGIAVSPIPEIGLGRAINDRLRRAAADSEAD